MAWYGLTFVTHNHWIYYLESCGFDFGDLKLYTVTCLFTSHNGWLLYMCRSVNADNSRRVPSPPWQLHHSNNQFQTEPIDSKWNLPLCNRDKEYQPQLRDHQDWKLWQNDWGSYLLSYSSYCSKKIAESYCFQWTAAMGARKKWLGKDLLLEIWHVLSFYLLSTTVWKYMPLVHFQNVLHQVFIIPHIPSRTHRETFKCQRQ